MSDNEPKELKVLYLLGPGIPLHDQIRSLLKNREDCLIIGDGINPFTANSIRIKLSRKNLKIGPNTRIEIDAHGDRQKLENNTEEKPKQHMTDLLSESKFTHKVFRSIGELAKSPVFIHLQSCHGGAANKNIKDLPESSILITDVESASEAWIPAINRTIKSLAHYLSNPSSTPEQQFLHSLRYFGSPMTFSKISESGEIKQYKTTRFLKDEFLQNLIKHLDKSSLKEILEDAIDYEKTKFCKIFKDELRGSNIELKPLNNREIQEGVIGGLMHSLDSLRTSSNSKSNLAEVITEIVPKLHEQNIDIDTPILGYTITDYLSTNGSLEVVKYLIENGADLKKIDSRGIQNIFKLAIEKNDLDFLATIAVKKEDMDFLVSVTELFPDAPLLHKAAKFNDTDLMSLLVESIGYDVNTINKFSSVENTPLQVACKSGSKEAVELLLEKGADINCQDREGSTPLHYAVKYGNKEMVNLLILKGAITDIADNNGKTPLNYAMEKGNKEIVNLLLKKNVLEAPIRYARKIDKPIIHINEDIKNENLKPSLVLQRPSRRIDQGR